MEANPPLYIVMPAGQPPARDDNGSIISYGVIGRITRGNAFLHPEYRQDETRRPDQLGVGECINDVAYSGSSGAYDLWRVQ